MKFHTGTFRARIGLLAKFKLFSTSILTEDYLVMQLAELVRMVFIAGTSNNDRLRLEGMKALQVS